MKTDKNHIKKNNDAPTSFDHLKEQNPFVLPDGYFDTLPLQVMNRIESAETQQTESRTIRRLWVPVAAVAAALTACFILFYLLIPSNDEPSGPQASQYTSNNAAIIEYLQNETEVDDESIIAVLLEDASAEAYDINDLPGLIPDDSITGQQKSAEPFVIDTTISSEDILQYLLDEGFEIDPNS